MTVERHVHAPSYVQELWTCREYWLHLTAADLRRRYLGTTLGAAWAILYPTLFAALIAVAFGALFGRSWRDYAPFALVGVIYWRATGTTLMGGANAFLRAAPYIKQRRLPLLVYTLKDELGSAVTSLIGGIPLLAFVLFIHGRIDDPAWWRLTPLLLAALTLLFFLHWGLASIAAFANVAVRDLGHALPIALQAVWYVSPVMIHPDVFRAAGLGAVATFNPVAHVLVLLRAPLLEARAPDIASWLVAAAVTASTWGVVALLIAHRERQLVFDL